MVRVLTLLCLTAFLISSTAFGALIPIGYISWDVHAPGSAGSFDISNQTGPNSSAFPDPTWPVVTPSIWEASVCLWTSATAQATRTLHRISH